MAYQSSNSTESNGVKYRYGLQLAGIVVVYPLLVFKSECSRTLAFIIPPLFTPD